MNLKQISFGLTLLAAAAGFVAAYYWYRSSKVPTNPTWITEPGEELNSQAGWIAGMMQASAEAARLNAVAAMWTGISVVLAVLSSIAAAF